MIIDKELELSEKQDVTVTAPSENYIDLGAVRDPGMSGPMHIAITVDTAATAAGAATVQFQIQKDSSALFGTVETVMETPAIPIASLKPGYQFFMPVPPGIDARYVRLNYVVGTGPLLTGAFTAQVVRGIQKNVAYPDAL